MKGTCNSSDATTCAPALSLHAQASFTLRDTEHARARGVEDGLGVVGLMDGGGREHVCHMVREEAVGGRPSPFRVLSVAPGRRVWRASRRRMVMNEAARAPVFSGHGARRRHCARRVEPRPSATLWLYGVYTLIPCHLPISPPPRRGWEGVGWGWGWGWVYGRVGVGKGELPIGNRVLAVSCLGHRGLGEMVDARVWRVHGGAFQMCPSFASVPLSNLATKPAPSGRSRKELWNAPP